MDALWAHVTLGFSTMLTQELGALLGGFAAEQGHMQLALVALTCATAVFTESIALYFFGRWRAAWVRLRLRKVSPAARKLLSVMKYNPWRSTILSRFALGARIPLPLACGAARLPIWIFVTGTAVASAIWAVLFVGLGWVFGQGAVLVVGELRRYEWVVGVVLAALALGISWWFRRRGRQGQPQDGSSTPLP